MSSGLHYLSVLYFAFKKKRMNETDIRNLTQTQLLRVQNCRKLMSSPTPPTPLHFLFSASLNIAALVLEPVSVHWRLALRSGLCWSSNGFEKSVVESKCCFIMEMRI